MKRKQLMSIVVAILVAGFTFTQSLFAQAREPQMGDPGRASYETFRMDKITSQGEASYSGDLNLSIPLLVVPGRHGHDFAVQISYNSHITQSQLASWVGLGWNLDIGGVERTIQGRADDQDPVYNQQHGYWLGPEQGAFCGPPYRATMYGKMSIREKSLALADRDQADMYNMIIDGGNTEAYFIPDILTDTVDYPGPYKFLAPRYNNWDIQAAWTPGSGPISGFTVKKEDGSKYLFGQDGNNNGSIDNVEIAGFSQGGIYNVTQQFSFPYRWSLQQIQYPDGSVTRVTYNKHNQGTQSSVRRKYESIGVDRSYGWVDNVFSPGIDHVPHSRDSVRYWYSSPESLYTDTHYLVFKSRAPLSDSMCARNRELDTLILYERLTGKELKRVIFFYARNDNPNSQGNQLSDWQRGTSLSNNQLTLDSVSVRTPDNRFEDAIPPFIFAYGKNPRFDKAFNQNYSQGAEFFPGYLTDTVFSTAWRLLSIQFPTGGRTEFSYQRLSGNPADPFTVCYDPEGNYSAAYPFSYNAQPRCRLVQKRVVDPLGVTQVWTYAYGTAVYDAPSRPLVGTYQPSVYASAKDYYYGTNYDYYMYYRGCPLGHRWVQVTFPNGSWKKTYFTSSYKAADRDLKESQPDTILSGNIPNNATVILSNYGRRGLVWKEETNLSSTIYYYAYNIQWKYTDPYTYFEICNNNNYSYQIELRSIWPHLDSVRTTTDGIMQQTNYSYNPPRITNYGVWNRTGPRSNPYYPGWQGGVAANGLVAKKVEKGDALTRSTTYQYACSRNNLIDAAFLLSQNYSTTISGGVDESRSWTTYGQIASLWLPISTWIWNDASVAYLAPVDTGFGVNVTSMRFTYDGSSNSDVISQLDANGNVTNFYYSSDTTNPFLNNASGLAMGRVTGVEKVRGGSMSPLRTSAIYDGYGNVTKLTSENGNVTRCIYDNLGRLTSIIGPNSQKLSDYSYAYFTSSPLQPNRVVANTYRTASDWTSARNYYDGIGYDLQKQISLGPLDIITHTAYDSMRHPAQRFLPYKTDLGGTSEHNYDPSFFSHDTAYHHTSGLYPFDLVEFERDPNGRPLNQFYSGTVFSSSDRANNKYTRLSYGANGNGLPDYQSGSVHKFTTLDENGNNQIKYTDKLGNTVLSVVDSGNQALSTSMDYDGSGRVLNVIMPNRYSVRNATLATDSLALSKPQSTGQIDLTRLPLGPKVLTVRLFADTVEKAFARRGYLAIKPNLYAEGITVVFNISQYSQGSLVAHQDSINIGDYPDDHPYKLTLPYVPAILPNVDEVKLVIDTVYWIDSGLGTICSSGTISLDCKLGGDFAFTYNKRGLVEQKTIPDQGTSNYLYDKNGNLRFVQDAAHTGTAADSTNRSANISCPNSTSGQFTLTMPGPVTITTLVYNIESSEYMTVKLKAKGAYVLSTSSSGWNGSSATLALPTGTYTYEVTTTSGSGAFRWGVTCQTGYEFVYNKYDALNRVIEQGEYSSNSISANFTKTNAENTSFPGSGYLSRTMLYDTVSTDAISSGQRNLRGKVSQVVSYRLGSVALTSFYSYDDFGRVEWVAYRGFGTNGMKMAYTYDLQNDITKKSFTDYANAVNNFYWWYEYDQAGRLARVYAGSDSLSRVKEAEYAYSASGKVTQLNLGATPAQTLSYTYTERDWLSTISSAQFWEHLGYNNIAEIGSALSSPAQYNGNISWMSYSENGNAFHWGPPQSTTILGYSFNYDSTNRLTAGKFGFSYNTSWSGWNSYNMPKIGYDKNGNIDTLVRYGTNQTLMDNLKYHYLANSNRLDYISDKVLSSTFTTDIDSQRAGNYRYDSNGNVQADSGSGMSFILYDINNLPVAEFKRDGTAIQYTYDNSGQRAIKLVGSSYTWYVPGSDGKTEVLYNNATTNPTYNLWGNDNTGYVRRTGPAITRYYYLKDHLGTNRMTVRGDSIVLSDDFSGDLSKWSTVLGGGFSIQSGTLVGTGGASDNVMINSSSAIFGDGVVSADVRDTADYQDANLVVRYQNPNNYYLIQAYGSQIIIFKKVAGTYQNKASVGISPDFVGGFFHLQVTMKADSFWVSWKGQLVLTYKDPSPWLSGKVGVRQCVGRHIYWDNFSAVTYSIGTVVAYDDFYPFGQIMDGRSTIIGQPDARYKFTGKERDTETGWDYFGARYYDSRSGRWLSIDPLAEKHFSWSPYEYSYCNPLRYIDPTGMEGDDILSSLWNGFSSMFAGTKSDDTSPSEIASPLSTEGQKVISGTKKAVEGVKDNSHQLASNVGVAAGDYSEYSTLAGVGAALVAVVIPETAPIMAPIASALFNAGTTAALVSASAYSADVALGGSSQKAVESFGHVAVDAATSLVAHTALGGVIRETGLNTAFRSVPTGQFITNAAGYSAKAGSELAGKGLQAAIELTFLHSK